MTGLSAAARSETMQMMIPNAVTRTVEEELDAVAIIDATTVRTEPATVTSPDHIASFTSRLEEN